MHSIEKLLITMILLWLLWIYYINSLILVFFHSILFKCKYENYICCIFIHINYRCIWQLGSTVVNCSLRTRGVCRFKFRQGLISFVLSKTQYKVTIGYWDSSWWRFLINSQPEIEQGYIHSHSPYTHSHSYSS